MKKRWVGDEGATGGACADGARAARSGFSPHRAERGRSDPCHASESRCGEAGERMQGDPAHKVPRPVGVVYPAWLAGPPRGLAAPVGESVFARGPPGPRCAPPRWRGRVQHEVVLGRGPSTPPSGRGRRPTACPQHCVADGVWRHPGQLAEEAQVGACQRALPCFLPGPGDAFCHVLPAVRMVGFEHKPHETSSAGI